MWGRLADCVALSSEEADRCVRSMWIKDDCVSLRIDTIKKVAHACSISSC